MATPIANMKATWANSSIQYTAIGMSVNALSFNADSRLLDLKANSNSVFSIDVAGNIYANNIFSNTSNTTNTILNSAISASFGKSIAMAIVFG
jgi:hypothetical protein